MDVTVGTEWAVDAYGCDPRRLRDRVTLERVLLRAVEELGLTVIGAGAWQVFPDHAGVTGMLLLTESHLVCHTYPEHGIATFNLYCCRARPEWPWSERLAEMLGADEVRVCRLDRGARASSEAEGAGAR
jgi:S-adenosylmethionine decarboxylase